MCQDPHIQLLQCSIISEYTNLREIRGALIHVKKPKLRMTTREL